MRTIDESNKVKRDRKVLLGLLGILLPLCVSPFISRAFLVKIILLCKCSLIDFVALLIVAALIFLFLCFLKTARKVNKLLYIGLVLAIIASIAFSIKPAIHYVIARKYYYYDRKVFKDDAQKHFLDKAKNHLNTREWDLCVKDLTQAKELFQESYYESEINEAIDETKLIIDYGERLHNSYVKPAIKQISLNSFKCAQILSKLYPIKYKMEYLALQDSVVSAIGSYPQLYEAAAAEDYEECRELILRHGWCWFEPNIRDKFLYDNKVKVMEWLHQYLDAEDVYSAQSRIEDNWLEDL